MGLDDRRFDSWQGKEFLLFVTESILVQGSPTGIGGFLPGV
jgi:hypothetical protein